MTSQSPLNNRVCVCVCSILSNFIFPWPSRCWSSRAPRGFCSLPYLIWSHLYPPLNRLRWWEFFSCLFWSFQFAKDQIKVDLEIIRDVDASPHLVTSLGSQNHETSWWWLWKIRKRIYEENNYHRMSTFPSTLCPAGLWKPKSEGANPLT